MKWQIFSILALVALTLGCVANQEPVGPGPDIGSSAPVEPEPQPPTIELEYCGLTVDFLSPSPNERVSGGFRVEWSLAKEGNGDFTNQQVNFTIYLKSAAGATTDLKKISRYYGELYKEDITFLSPIAKGLYKVGVRGKLEDGCNVHESEVDIEIG